MANMNYCRMENTYHDLLDVERNWDYAESDSELEYRKRILELAKEIVRRHDEEEIGVVMASYYSFKNIPLTGKRDKSQFKQ